MRKQSGFLDGVTNVAAKLNHVPLRGGAAIDEYLAFTLRYQTVDELERCGLAGTAAPQQHERFTAADGKIEIRDERAITVDAVGDVDEFNCRCWRVIHRQRKA